MAARTEDNFLCDFYSGLAARLKLRRVTGGDLPEGVTAQERRDGQTRFLFLLNCDREPKVVPLEGNNSLRDFFDNAHVGKAIALAPYEARILTEDLGER